MYFAWDEIKNQRNKQKHGISFELAKHVFNDAHLLSWIDNHSSDYEERWISLSCVDEMLVVVIHTYRSGNEDQEIIRIISAREATQKECEKYFSCQK